MTIGWRTASGSEDIISKIRASATESPASTPRILPRRAWIARQVASETPERAGILCFLSVGRNAATCSMCKSVTKPRETLETENNVYYETKDEARVKCDTYGRLWTGSEPRAHATDGRSCDGILFSFSSSVSEGS